MNVRRWFVVVVRVRIYFSTLKFDVILTAIYGYHTSQTCEFIGPHICTQYVSITVYIEGVHLTLPPHIFPAKQSHGVCYITGQWG